MNAIDIDTSVKVWHDYLDQYATDHNIRKANPYYASPLLREASVPIIKGDNAFIAWHYSYHLLKARESYNIISGIVRGFLSTDKEVKIVLDEELYPELKAQREAEKIQQEKLCQAREDERHREMIAQGIVDIGRRAGVSLDTYTISAIEITPGNREAIELVKAWRKDANSYHHFITLIGECGRGKTKIALTMFAEWVKECQDAMFYAVPQFLNELRQGYKDDLYNEFVDECRDIGLLVLDDLGVQKNTDWVTEQLDMIIDYRYLRHKNTIFTTNLGIDGLPTRIGSRLSEGEILLLKGDDFRKVLAERRRGKENANSKN